MSEFGFICTTYNTEYILAPLFVIKRSYYTNLNHSLIIGLNGFLSVKLFNFMGTLL